MAVGATLDFEAGKMQRAPALVSQAGMEWLHRLLSEPGRLWHRYLVRDPKFLWLVLLQRFVDPYFRQLRVKFRAKPAMRAAVLETAK